MLTSQRRNQIPGMTRPELSDDRRNLEHPGQQNEKRRAHTVPLSPPLPAADCELEGQARQSLHFHDDRHHARVWLEPMKDRLDAASSQPRARSATRSFSRGHCMTIRKTFVTGMFELHVPPHVIDWW